MLNLDLAKEIILKKNNDGTYNLIAKMNVQDSNKNISEMECNCLRVKIKSLDVELLSTGNTLMQFETHTEISNPITEKVLKDSPLTHKPHDIYEIIEGDEYDVVTYDYEKVYIK